MSEEHAEMEYGGTLGSDSSRRPGLRRRIVVGFLIGSVIGLIVAFGAVVLVNRGQLPIMKGADFEAAESRWKTHGPTSYDLDMEGTFDLGKGHTHVEVRKGEVTALTLDGQAKPQREWKSYSVPGLFGIIRDDIDGNEVAAKNPGDQGRESVLQQAEFDPQLGYPRRYQRTGSKSGRTGEWKIVKFQSVD